MCWNLYKCPGGSDGKASAYNAGDPGLISGPGRSPGEGNGTPLQYSCLENPMDGGAWWATVHGVAKSRTRLSDCTFTFTSLSPYGRKQRITKELLDESERGEWKCWLKTQHSKNEDHGIWSRHFMANRWGNSVRLYFLGLQNHCRWWLQPWN